MATKSIIDIEVNDAQFKAFYDLFEEYKKHIGTIPNDWVAIDAATKKAGKSFQAMAAGTEAIMAEIALNTKSIAEDIKKATREQKAFRSAAHQSGNELRKMAGYAAHVGKSIFGIGKYLFKIGALGGGISLLGGFGLRELGASAVEGQKRARGIGLTQGQIKAWHVDMQRYADVSMLQNVANAQTSPQGMVNLSMASGLSLQQVQAMKPDELAYRIMRRERELWKSTPKGLRTINPYINAGMQVGMTQEQIRTLAHAPGSELSTAHAQYLKNSGQFNIGDKATSAWWKFVRELEVAGATIQKVLTNRLSELAPYLASFVNSLTKDAEAFINGALTPQNLKRMEDGLQSIAAYLGSPQFRENLYKFGEAVMDVTNAILKVAGWLAPHKDLKHSNANPDLMRHPLSHFPPSVNHRVASGIVGKVYPTKAQAQAQLGALEKQYGLPPGLLTAVYGAESDYGRNAGYSEAGALGPFQFTSTTATDWGVKDRSSFGQSSVGAARYYQALLKKYKGDTAKAAAAYNWGPGNVDKDVAMNGPQWRGHVPNETRGYLNQVLSALAKRQPSATVRIENNSNARVFVQANAAAY